MSKHDKDLALLSHYHFKFIIFPLNGKLKEISFDTSQDTEFIKRIEKKY